MKNKIILLMITCMLTIQPIQAYNDDIVGIFIIPRQQSKASLREIEAWEIACMAIIFTGSVLAAAFFTHTPIYNKK